MVLSIENKEVTAKRQQRAPHRRICTTSPAPRPTTRLPSEAALTPLARDRRHRGRHSPVDSTPEAMETGMASTAPQASPTAVGSVVCLEAPQQPQHLVVRTTVHVVFIGTTTTAVVTPCCSCTCMGRKQPLSASRKSVCSWRRRTQRRPIAFYLASPPFWRLAPWQMQAPPRRCASGH